MCITFTGIQYLPNGIYMESTDSSEVEVDYLLKTDRGWGHAQAHYGPWSVKEWVPVCALWAGSGPPDTLRHWLTLLLCSASCLAQGAEKTANHCQRQSIILNTIHYTYIVRSIKIIDRQKNKLTVCSAVLKKTIISLRARPNTSYFLT